MRQISTSKRLSRPYATWRVTYQGWFWREIRRMMCWRCTRQRLTFTLKSTTTRTRPGADWMSKSRSWSIGCKLSCTCLRRTRRLSFRKWPTLCRTRTGRATSQGSLSTCRPSPRFPTGTAATLKTQIFRIVRGQCHREDRTRMAVRSAARRRVATAWS